MMITRLLVFVALFLLSGCSTYAASRYSISAENIGALRAFRGEKQVNVGPFTATEPGQSEIMCRGVGPIKTPDGEPFEAFIRKALLDELMIAEVYSLTAPVTLTGRLDGMDFSSGLTDAAWEIALTLTSSNGKALSVKERYVFTSSYYGETACNQTAHALMPAVQNLIRNVVAHIGFRELIDAAAVRGEPQPVNQSAVPVTAPAALTAPSAPAPTSDVVWERYCNLIWPGQPDQLRACVEHGNPAPTQPTARIPRAAPSDSPLSESKEAKCRRLYPSNPPRFEMCLQE